MNNKSIKGILLVAIGASSYGVVATFIKKGLAAGYTTAELTFAQALIGALFMILLNLIFNRTSSANTASRPPRKEIYRLLLGGIPLGLTSTFYYLSLQYIPVSVCIVMLMQSVWIGVIIDLLVNKIKPTPIKLTSIVIVLVGTIFATNVLNTSIDFDWRGVFWGFLASISYSLTFLVTNNVATGYRPMVRSMYML